MYFFIFSKNLLKKIIFKSYNPIKDESCNMHIQDEHLRHLFWRENEHVDIVILTVISKVKDSNKDFF